MASTASLLSGLRPLCGLFSVATLVSAIAPVCASAQSVLHTFSDNFDGLLSSPIASPTAVNGQNGWTSDAAQSSIQTASVVPASGGGNVLVITGNKWAAHAIDQGFVGEANTLFFSWTQRATVSAEQPTPGKNHHLTGGGALYSGSNAWTDPLLSIVIQRSADTGWNKALQYTQWNSVSSVYDTITVPTTGEGSFAPTNTNTYAFTVTVDMDAHSYSFTVTDADSLSIAWTSPWIALNPNLGFPRWMTLYQVGGADGGAVFDNVVLQQIKTSSVPEPGTYAVIAGAAALLFGCARRRRC